MNLVLDKSKELKTVFICSLIYLVSFTLLEKIQFSEYIYTETWIDAYIPFLDIFVIPYMMWFAYIVLGFCYFLLNDVEGFYRTCFYIFAGMYVCLIIYTLFPNAQGLRVNLDLNEPLQRLLSIVYSVDTSTNVCPSIHVYNSVMMLVSLCKNDTFQKSSLWKILIGILTILICLSTIFTKQHAFIDIIYALMLCFSIYHLEQILRKKNSLLKQ